LSKLPGDKKSRATLNKVTRLSSKTRGFPSLSCGRFGFIIFINQR